MAATPTRSLQNNESFTPEDRSYKQFLTKLKKRTKKLISSGPEDQTFIHTAPQSVVQDLNAGIVTGTPDSVLPAQAPSTAANVPSESTSSKDSGTAYVRAVAKLSPEQRILLQTADDLQNTIDKIHEIRKGQVEESKYEKGRKVILACLEQVRNVAGLTVKLAPANTTAGTALGLIKGALDVLDQFLGVATKVDAQIERFCALIPTLIKYDAASIETDDDIVQHLEKLFSGLLDFLLVVTEFVQRRNTAWLSFKDLLTNKIAPKIEDFNKTLQDFVLAITINTNTQVIGLTVLAIQQRLDQQLVQLIDQEELNIDSDPRGREDTACEWILQTSQYKQWNTVAAFQPLALIDNHGIGKTFTISYLASHLKACGRVVCSYQVARGLASTRPNSVYRMLLYQLITSIPSARQKWESRSTSTGGSQPIIGRLSRQELEAILTHCLDGFQEVIYIILDGLDESDNKVRQEIKELLSFLRSSQISFKVLLASDPDAAPLPDASCLHLTIPRTIERDRVLTEFWVDRSNLEPALRRQATVAITQRANHSAIWIMLAVAFVDDVSVTTIAALEEELRALPSSDRISEIYGGLYEKACRKAASEHRRKRLRTGLEILAAAQRPLTRQELRIAVELLLGEKAFKSTKDLHDASSQSLWDVYLRPFIAQIQSGAEVYQRQQLVHHSLRSLILLKPIDQWSSQQQESIPESRFEGLHQRMYATCTMYLLLSTDSAITTDQDAETGDEWLLCSPFGLDIAAENPESPIVASHEKTSETFFRYAISNWTFHLSQIRHLGNTDLANLQTLCIHSEVNGYKIAVDALQVVAEHGSHEVVLQVAAQDTTLNLSRSTWSKVISYLTDRSMPKTILDLSKQLGAIGRNLCRLETFDHIVTSWPTEERTSRVLHQEEWIKLFDYLIHKLYNGLLQSSNAVLQSAARYGCLLLIERLFVAAGHDSVLKESLLKECPLTTSTHRYEHQSPMGQAMLHGHKSIFHYLASQSGIKEQIISPNRYGMNMFHLAARLGEASYLPKLYAIWPEGIDLPDADGWRPLAWTVDGSLAEQNAVFLLETGKVKINYTGDDGRAILHHAAARGQIKVISKLLDFEELDVMLADADGCTPIMLANRNNYHKIADMLQTRVDDLAAN